jgi:Ca2+-binding EF-hand superfamily protein
VLLEKKEALMNAIKMFDTEGGADGGDGFISQQEMVKILTRKGFDRNLMISASNSLKPDDADQKWNSWLKAFDANGDGKISIEEIAEALAHTDEVKLLYECCEKAYKGPVLEVGEIRELLDSLAKVGKGKFLQAPITAPTSTRPRWPPSPRDGTLKRIETGKTGMWKRLAPSFSRTRSGDARIRSRK